MLLEEFDNDKTAVINPKDVIKKKEDIPKVAVSCYSYVTFNRMIDELQVTKIAETSCANGLIPIYRTTYMETDIALFMINVGAPMSVAILEDVYQMGIEKVILFGTCGVLDKKINDCSIVIPNCALRDEGTSYHYLPANDEIKVNEKYLSLFKNMLDEIGVKYTVGKVWSTDAIYRETANKIKKRKEQGCICVDMECSANAAVSQFRNKDLIQFFYAADNLDSDNWDSRSLSNFDKLDEKDRIASIALQLATRINKK